MSRLLAALRRLIFRALEAVITRYRHFKARRHLGYGLLSAWKFSSKEWAQRYD
jgi:hypothetical protein